jgi:hypothetical protein
VETQLPFLAAVSGAVLAEVVVARTSSMVAEATAKKPQNFVLG